MLLWFLIAAQAALGQPLSANVAATMFHTVKAPAPADWKPSEADEADARRFVGAYFAKRDAGQMEAALAMFKPTVVKDRRGWVEQMQHLNKKLGTGKRRLTAVTWYVNPPSASQPGIFAAVDFVGEYPNAPVYCGYVALIRRAAGTFEIIREQQNVVSLSDGPFNSTELAQMRSAMCPAS